MRTIIEVNTSHEDHSTGKSNLVIMTMHRDRWQDKDIVVKIGDSNEFLVSLEDLTDAVAILTFEKELNEIE